MPVAGLFASQSLLDVTNKYIVTNCVRKMRGHTCQVYVGARLRYFGKELLVPFRS